MKNFFVYILYAPNHDKYYIGQTNDLQRRFIEHNESPSLGYTAKYRPWTLLVSLEVNSRSEAMLVEKYLKKKPRQFLLRVATDLDLQKYINSRFESK